MSSKRPGLGFSESALAAAEELEGRVEADLEFDVLRLVLALALAEEEAEELAAEGALERSRASPFFFRPRGAVVAGLPDPFLRVPAIEPLVIHPLLSRDEWRKLITAGNHNSMLMLSYDSTTGVRNRNP